MTPKEKALELFESYYMYVDKPYETNAKECALIAVEEIIKSYPHAYDTEITDNNSVYIITNVRSNIAYWQDVKTEIKKL